MASCCKIRIRVINDSWRVDMFAHTSFWWNSMAIQASKNRLIQWSGKSSILTCYFKRRQDEARESKQAYIALFKLWRLQRDRGRVNRFHAMRPSEPDS
jgi:hypothetical protein